jgi:hypothetical protein
MPAKQPADRGQIHRGVPASVSPACPYGRNTGGELVSGRNVRAGVGQGHGYGKKRNSARRVLCCRRSLCPARVLGGDEGVSTGGGILRAARRRSFLTRPDFTVFRKVVAGLREHCPAAYPIVVRTGCLPGDIDGFCRRTSRRFVIHLSDTLSQSAAIDVLVHEWAHARAWNMLLDKASKDADAGRITAEDFEAASHGPEFGVCFAAVWSVVSLRILPRMHEVGVAG